MVRPGAETVLKILNGSQNGVEIELDEGEYVLGNGPEDDLQFIDVALRPGHAHLRLDGGALALKAGTGAVRTSTGLDLSPGEGEWRDIDQLDIVTIGTTRFAVGAATARWAELIAASKAVDSPPSATAKSRFGGWPRGMSMRSVVLPVVLLIGVLWIAASAMESHDNPLGLLSDERRDELTLVKEIVDGFAFAHDVKVDEEVDGSVYVRGYVDELVERRAIVNALREAGVQPHVRLWVRETIAREIENLIAARKVNVAYTLSNDGVVTLAGVVVDPERADDFVALLEEQLLGVGEIVSELRTGDTILAEVRELAKRSGLNGSVHFHRTGRLIEANGAVRNSALDGYVGFLQAYAKRFARLVPLRTRVSVEGMTLTIPGEALVLAGPQDDTDATGQRLDIDSLPDLGSEIRELFGDPTENPGERENGTATTGRNPLTTEAFGEAVRARDDDTTGDGGDDGPGDPRTTTQLPQAVRLIGAAPHPMPLTGTALAMATSPVSSQRYRRALQVGGSDVAPISPRPPTVARDAAPAVVSPEVRQAFGRLSDATGALIDAFGEGTLSELVGKDEAPDVSAAIEDLDTSVRDVSESATFLPAERREAIGMLACWPGARIAIDMLPQIIFWLDLLSISQELQLADLDVENRGVLLEAALSPERVADCLERVGTSRAERMRQASVFLSETERNARFIEFIVRGVEAQGLEIVGANLLDRRYVQLVSGRKLAEGSAPDGATRIASIGEVGVLLRSVDGFSAAVYPATLAWKIR